MTYTTVVCLFAGLVLGLAFAAGGFGALLLTALLGAAGVVVAKVLEGEIDLGDLNLDPNRRRPR
ncbi:MAG TPA: hypothetical protein VE760_01975 [Acidimicrobiales bacterium]|nr:hypothetical protein [Acidimicrobiales bacterium]